MIYIITAGSYSDYHIIAATTDKESAEKIAEHFDADIEEFENSTPKILEMKHYQYLFTYEGMPMRCNVLELDEFELMRCFDISATSNVYKNIRNVWIVNVYTDKPKEVADKIAYDLLAEARAKKEGI